MRQKVLLMLQERERDLYKAMAGAPEIVVVEKGMHSLETRKTIRDIQELGNAMDTVKKFYEMITG